jgi:hypothetical protein
MTRWYAKKTPCAQGHTHASGKEAKRCNDLHLLQRAGHISGLQLEPRFTFIIEGRELKMGNGQVARYTADFTYVENGRKVVEEIKPKDAKGISRDFPMRAALFRHLWPSVELRVVK